ncbi:trna pseudouridine synthase ii trub [Lucifera butyrica]|uniref:tRNA pseudouridine synthase B n=1 Tax=Lucifera butyrica TaxID=1351585 RepID=A0A498RAN6_9FIRM|nr:tRNA pseudouridine(55) synthase TruB [Lucifera butyrica]VBB08045.1 trna pseudouridine synthase ii trub [Lucifera butyrica]
MTGIINVLKPPGMTSHDVVAFVRRTLGEKKAGHAGTLDPAAAGVLPVFLGQATRIIEYTTDCSKSYRAELTFGYETDTGDDTGEVLRSAPYPGIAAEQIETVLASFAGTSRQIPPMYSAVKVAGRKMYELARAGMTVEREARTIFIDSIQLIKITEAGILFDVTCSKGTYIRSLCMDIGQKLGYPAVMSFLVRTRVGNFTLADAVLLEQIAEQKEAVILPLDYALGHMPQITLNSETAKRLQNGQAVETGGSPAGLFRIYDHSNRLVGIGRQQPDSVYLTPVKVLNLG